MKFKLAFLICFLTNVIFSQEICPVENVSVFGGDSQNIVSWDEPANPFVSTFTLELTTDTYGYEIIFLGFGRSIWNNNSRGAVRW